MTPEIVITVGLPGSGKSTYVKALVDQGYFRINRDEIGGTLTVPNAPIYQYLWRAYTQGGVRRFVIDNTYMFPEHRAVVLQVAKELGLPVRVLWLKTTLEQAQVFAARRQIQKLGRLLRPSEYKAFKDDPGMFPPGVQYKFAKDGTPPSLSEGFTSIEEIEVETVWGPDYTNKAIILDLDGTVRTSTASIMGIPYPRKPEEVQIIPGRATILKEWRDAGYLLLGATNQSGVDRDPRDPKYVSEADVQACIATTCKGLGLDIDVLYSTDRGGPPQSFWRKPMPGMGVALIEKYKLCPSMCTYVGDMTTDKTFAERCGFQYMHPDYFFREKVVRRRD